MHCYTSHDSLVQTSLGVRTQFRKIQDCTWFIYHLRSSQIEMYQCRIKEQEFWQIKQNHSSG